MRPEPFRLQVPEQAISDLKERLARTRFPDEPPLEPWQTGTSLAYLKELVDYWRAGFDWRLQEGKLNGFRQYRVEIGGIPLHFIHEPGRGASPIPLLLMHGWPGSVWEFHRLIPLLTERFTIVAPSLPGFTLSFRPGQPRFGVEEMAEVFA
ncbi:MAG TPA: epoxide hydrolase, partial [Burkholderiales bacterium]|nr:epoxide hydrolase [Burkholderiales bacterium]